VLYRKLATEGVEALTRARRAGVLSQRLWPSVL
jgi:hypothetical protein